MVDLHELKEGAIVRSKTKTGVRSVGDLCVVFRLTYDNSRIYYTTPRYARSSTTALNEFEMVLNEPWYDFILPGDKVSCTLNSMSLKAGQEFTVKSVHGKSITVIAENNNEMKLNAHIFIPKYVDIVLCRAKNKLKRYSVW